MRIVSLPDVTPNGTAVALAAVGIKAVWVAVSCSGTTGRIGDSGAGASEGLVLAQNAKVELPRCDFAQGQYDLGEVFVYATGADKVSILYGK